MWTRAFSGPRPSCARLTQVLQRWGCGAMLVGHTPQEHGINGACENRVWRCDVGMSKAFGARGSRERVQVLDVRQLPNGKYRIAPLSFGTQQVVLPSALPSESTPKAKKPPPPKVCFGSGRVSFVKAPFAQEPMGSGAPLQPRATA